MLIEEFNNFLNSIGFNENNNSPYILTGIRTYAKNSTYDKLNGLLKDKNFKIDNFDPCTLICGKIPLAIIYLLFVDDNVPEWMRFNSNKIICGGTLATWWCIARNVYIKLNTIEGINIKLNNDCPEWMRHDPDIIISKHQQRRIIDYYLLVNNIPNDFIPEWMIPKNKSIYTAVRFMINRHIPPPKEINPGKHAKTIDNITMKSAYLIYVNILPVPDEIDDGYDYKRDELFKLSKSQIFAIEDIPFPICHKKRGELGCTIICQHMDS